MADQTERIIIEIDGSGVKGEAQQVERAINTIGDAADKAGKKVDAAEKGINELGGALKTTGSSAKTTERDLQSLQSTIGNTRPAQAQADALKQVANSAKQSASEMSNLGRTAGGGVGQIRGITSAATPAASAMSSLSGAAGLLVRALPLVGTAAAAINLTGLISQSTQLAARYETLGVVMSVVGKNAGYTSTEMERFDKSLQKTGISMAESRNNLAKMASANIDLANATKLARIAQDAAVIGNMNSSQAFESLIYGIQSAQVEVLRTIGINVNFEQSYKKLADQLGKTSNELTEAEKTQARLNAVMEKAPSIAGAYEASMDTVGKKLGSTERLAENAKTMLGALFLPSWTAAVDAYSGALVNVNEELERIDVGKAQLLGRALADVFKQGNPAAATPGGFMFEVWLNYQNQAEAANVAVKKSFVDTWGEIERVGMNSANTFIASEDQRKATIQKSNDEILESFRKLNQTQIDKLDEQRDAFLKAGVSRADADRWYAGARAKIEESVTKKHATELKKQVADAKKARAEMLAGGKSAEAAMDKYWQDYEDRRIDAIAERTAKAVKLRVDAEKEAADKAKEILEKQEADAQKVMDNIQSATADVFYDMFQNIGDGWTNLWDSMKSWALRTLAELAARAATMQIVVPIMTSMTGTSSAAQAVQSLTGGGGGLGLGDLSNVSKLLPDSWTQGASSLLAYQLPGTTMAYTGAYSGVGAAQGMYATGLGYSSNAVASGALQGMTLNGQPIVAMNTPAMTTGMSLGSAMGYGAWGGLGYTYLGGAVGLPQSKWSGLTASAGGAAGAYAGTAAGVAMGAKAGSVYPVVGTIIGAIIGGLAGSLIGGGKEMSPSVLFQKQLHEWGQSGGIEYHLKDSGKKSTADQITEYLDEMFESSEKAVEELLKGLGDGYVEQLKGVTTEWGRKAGGLWRDWDFGADMDMSALMDKAAADIQHATFEAASGALTKAGQDLIKSTEVVDLLGSLSEQPARQLQNLMDVIAKGAEEGKAEEYANHIVALNTTLRFATEAWNEIDQQIEDLINPPSDYEKKVRSTNKQFDEWVSTLTTLGFSSEKLKEVEEKRKIVLDGLTKSIADLTKAEQDMVNARKDELAARRAKEDVEQKAYQERLAAYEKSGEDFQKLADALLKAGDAAGLLRANIDRAFANPKGTYTAGGYEYKLPHGMPTTAEEYRAIERLIKENSEQWAAQKRDYEYQQDLMYARMARDVNANVSANMLRIMNAGFVDPGVSELAGYYIGHAMESLSSDLRGLVGSAVSASVTTSTWSQFMPAGPGLAEIGRVSQEIANTKNEMLAVENSMSNLNRTLKQGIVDADTYARGIEAVSNALPNAYSAYQELQSMTYEERLVAQEKQAAAEREMLVNAGIRSANYYFSELNKMVKELGEAAQAANTELGKLESTMGYLRSFADAFGYSARAASGGAYQYGLDAQISRSQDASKEWLEKVKFAYGKDSARYASAKEQTEKIRFYNDMMLANSLASIPLIESDVGRNSAIVAEAAKKAMSVLTTRSAAAMAEELKKLPAFADLLPESLRDMSLLMDGIAQYDAEGFLNAFYRISDALNTGTINAEQFAQMFDLSLDVFENGIKDAAKKMSAQDLADLWEKILQASMDLVSPPTDYEMQVRQINEQYKEWIDTLKEAGAEQEKLTLLEEHRVTVLENLAKKQAELIEKELASINRDISHLLDPLSEYEQQLYSLNEQFDAWAETLKELGATTEQLISIESQRAVVLENLRLTTDVATAEEALRASFAKESETLNKIITDHANLLAEKGAALKTAYSEELSRLDKIIADHDQKVSTAKSGLQRAYQKEQSELQQTSDRFKMLAKQLEDWRTAFWSGTDSPLDFEQRTEMLYGNFRTALEKALSGDEDSFGKLAGDASSYLQAAKENASTREDYARIAGGIAAQMKEAEKAAEGQKSVADKQLEALELQAKGVEGLVEASLSFADAFAAYNKAVADAAAADAEKQKELVEEQMKQTGLIDEVLDWTTALNAFLDVQANREAEEAQAQLDALTTQVNALLKIDESVLSIGEAINNLARAQQALAAAQAARAAADLAAAQAARAAADLAAAQAARAAAKETYVKGYASGGYHTGGLRIVGERGPELESTGASRIWSADETRNILMGGGNNGVVIEIQKLREDMAAANYAIAKNTAATANMLGRWDGDGMPEERAM